MSINDILSAQIQRQASSYEILRHFGHGKFQLVSKYPSMLLLYDSTDHNGFAGWGRVAVSRGRSRFLLQLQGK